MFAKGGGVPGYAKGAFRIKGDGLDIGDQFREYFWKGLAGLQKKIIGGSSIPKKQAEFLAEQEKIDTPESQVNQ